MNDGVKQCLGTRCGLWWSGAAALPTLHVASGCADTGAVEGGSSTVAYITKGVHGQYSADVGAGLSSFV